MFKNRNAAGKELAEKLKSHKDREDVVVLALPRGGVVIGFEVANALNAKLDVLLVRKLGVPGHEELAMGALASGGIKFFNSSIIGSLKVPQSDIDAVIEREQKVIENREKLYRGTREFVDLTNKTIILVDDGIATGATIRVAIISAQKNKLQQNSGRCPCCPQRNKLYITKRG